MDTLKIIVLLIPLISIQSKSIKMKESIRISQLPPAANSDLDDRMQIPILTRNGKTKRAEWGSVKSQASCEVVCGSLFVPSAQVQTLNSSPIELIEAQGAGKAVVLLDAEVRLEYTAPAYSIGTLLLVSGGAVGVYQAICNDILFATGDTFSTFEMLQGQDLGNVDQNQPIYLMSNIANPLNGNSDITIYYRYKIIEI